MYWAGGEGTFPSHSALSSSGVRGKGAVLLNSGWHPPLYMTGRLGVGQALLGLIVREAWRRSTVIPLNYLSKKLL